MSTDWKKFPEEMLAAQAASETFRSGLDAEEQKRFDAEVMAFQQNQTRMLLDEITFRRQWAARIREAFRPYHEHSADGGECGACGALQAADWMDPDHRQDGPLAETYGAWKGRQS